MSSDEKFRDRQEDISTLFDRSYFSSYIPTEECDAEAALKTVGKKHQKTIEFVNSPSKSSTLPGLRSKSTKVLNENFELLRRVEYEEYLEELQAINNMAKKSSSSRSTTPLNKPMSFEEFVQDPKILSNERYFHYFKYGPFFKYFFAHFIFFLLGPLSYPFMFPLYGRNDMYNMMFFGNSKGFWMQFVVWVAVFAPIVLWFSDPDSGLLSNEISGLVSTQCFRAFIMAIRYGYAPHTVLFLQTKLRRNYENLQRDFAITAWKRLEGEAVDKEIEIAMIRTNVDNDLFLMKPAEPINSSEALDRLHRNYYPREKKHSGRKRTGSLKKIRRERSLWIGSSSSKSNAEECGPTSRDTGEHIDPRNDQPFPARSLARELLLNARANQSNLTWTYIIFALSLFAPTMVRLQYGDPPLGDTWYKGIIYVLLFLANAFSGLVTLIFYNVAITDSERKLFLMRSLTSMISVHRDYSFDLLNCSRLMDLYDPKTISSWYKLRNLMMDVGQRFSARVYVYFSVCVLGSLLVFVMQIATVLGFIEATDKDRSLYILYFGLFLTLMFSTLSIVLYNGASINDQFKIHQDLLRKNHIYYRDAQMYQDSLNPNMYYVNSMMAYAADKIRFLTRPKEFGYLISDLMQLTEDIHNKLETDEQRVPYRILGIKIDWTIFGTMGTIVISFVGFLIQYYTTGGFQLL